MLKWNQLFILIVVCWWVTSCLTPVMAEPNRHETQTFEDTENQAANRANALNSLRGLGINLPATARMVKELAEKNPASIQENDFRAALEKIPGLTPQQKDGLLKQFLNLGGQEFFVVTSNYLNELSASTEAPVGKKGKESSEDDEKKKQAEEEKKKNEENQKKFQEILLKALQKKEEKKQEAQGEKEKGREEGRGNEKGGGEGRGAGGENQEREKNKDRNKELHDEQLKKKENPQRGARENSDNEKKDNKKDEKENKKESNKDSVESLLKELDSQKEKDASKKTATETKTETPSPVRTPDVQPPTTVNRIADLGPKSALQPLTGSVGAGSFLNLGSNAGAGAAGLGGSPITPNPASGGPLGGASSGSDLSSMRFSEDYSGYAAPSGGISQFFKGNFYSEGGATSEASSSSNESPEGEYAMSDYDSRNRSNFKGAQIISQPHAEKEMSGEFGIFSVKEALMKKVMLDALSQ